MRRKSSIKTETNRHTHKPTNPPRQMYLQTARSIDKYYDLSLTSPFSLAPPLPHLLTLFRASSPCHLSPWSSCLISSSHFLYLLVFPLSSHYHPLTISSIPQHPSPFAYPITRVCCVLIERWYSSSSFFFQYFVFSFFFFYLEWLERRGCDLLTSFFFARWES